MKRLSVAAVFATLVLSATIVSAQATRTFVSGVGDDANPCSRTAPCKTWAGAIAKTSPGGEIDALDPGGFGALTITKSITLDGGGGQVASVLVAGTNGLTIAAGPTDVVNIHNLRLDGLLGNGSSSGNAGLTGISFLSGKTLNIVNCFIFGFNTAGISASLSASAIMTIQDTVIENIGSCSGSCTAGQGDGIFATSSSGTVKVQVNNTKVLGTANNGVETNTGGLIAFDNGAILNGANGVTATNGTIDVSHSTIAYNTGAAYNPVTGHIFVFTQGSAIAVNGTNRIHDNGSVGTPTAYVSQN